MQLEYAVIAQWDNIRRMLYELFIQLQDLLAHASTLIDPNNIWPWV